MSVTFNQSEIGAFKPDSSIHSVLFGTGAMLLENELNEAQWLSLEKQINANKSFFTSGFLQGLQVTFNNTTKTATIDGSNLAVLLDGLFLRLSDVAALTRSFSAVTLNNTNNLLFLEAWFQTVETNSVKQKGDIESNNNLSYQIVDPRTTLTSKRIQLQWKIRLVPGATSLTSVNPEVSGYTSNYALQANEYNLYTSVKSASQRNIEDVVYALPIANIGQVSGTSRIVTYLYKLCKSKVVTTPLISDDYTTKSYVDNNLDAIQNVILDTRMLITGPGLNPSIPEGTLKGVYSLKVTNTTTPSLSNISVSNLNSTTDGLFAVKGKLLADNLIYDFVNVLPSSEIFVSHTTGTNLEYIVYAEIVKSEYGEPTLSLKSTSYSSTTANRLFTDLTSDASLVPLFKLTLIKSSNNATNGTVTIDWLYVCKRKNSSVINVEDYGLSDLDTDNSAPIRFAIKHGNHVELPSGSFNVGQLYLTGNDIEISGKGFASTTLIQNTSSVLNSFIMVDGGSSVHLKNISLIGTKESVLNFISSKEIELENVKISNGFSYTTTNTTLTQAIKISSCERVLIRNTTIDGILYDFSGNLRYSFGFSRGIFSESTADLSIENCTFLSNKVGVVLTNTQTIDSQSLITHNIKNMYVDNSVFSNVERGIVYYSSGVNDVSGLIVTNSVFANSGLLSAFTNVDSALTIGGTTHGVAICLESGLVSSESNLSAFRIFVRGITYSGIARGQTTNFGMTVSNIGTGSSMTRSYHTNDVDQLNSIKAGRSAGFSSAPTTGLWAKGDIVLNSSPDAGEYLGWVCVTGGSPGTWKGFGLIQS